MLQILKTAQQALMRLLQSYQATMKTIHEQTAKNRLLIERQKVKIKRDFLVQAIDFMRWKYVFVGEGYISHGKYEQGLDAWECLLKFDPSNAYIHKRLDELLESVASTT